MLFYMICAHIMDYKEAERLASVVIDQARSAREKVGVLEISISFYGQQLQENKAMALGLQALQVSKLLPCSLLGDNTVNYFVNTNKKLLGIELERKEPFMEISDAELDALPEMQNQGKLSFFLSFFFLPFLFYPSSILQSLYFTQLKVVSLVITLNDLRDTTCDADYACSESNCFQKLSCCLLPN